MKERYYFFARNLAAARDMIADLGNWGLSEEDLHVIADENIELEELPEPDLLHRSDVVHAAKRGAAAGGAMGLIGGSVMAVTVPPVGLTLGGGALLAGTAVGTALGTWFSTLIGVSVPNRDVQAFRDRLERGEVMVIVDIPGERQLELRRLVATTQPETVLLQGSLDAA